MRTYYVIARSRTEILHIYPDEEEARVSFAHRSECYLVEIPAPENLSGEFLRQWIARELWESPLPDCTQVEPFFVPLPYEFGDANRVLAVKNRRGVKENDDD